VQAGRLTQDQATKLDARIDQWQGRVPFGFWAGFRDGMKHARKQDIANSLRETALNAAAGVIQSLGGTVNSYPDPKTSSPRTPLTIDAKRYTYT